MNDPFGLADFPPPHGARERIAESVLRRSTLRDPLDPAPIPQVPTIVVRPSGRSSHRSGPRRLTVVVSIAAAVLVVVGLFASTVRTDGGGEGEVLSALPAATLSDLATTAASLPDRPLRTGEYQRLLMEEAAPYVGSDGTEGRAVTTVKTWVDAADAGREFRSDALVVAGAAPPTSLSLADTGYDLRDNDPGSLPLAGVGYETIRALPRDATELEQSLTEAMSVDDPQSIGVTAALLLALDVTPPPTRVAAFEMLEALGYELVGEVTDRGGRTGVGFALEGPRGAHVIVFDPTTGRALDEYLGPSTDPGSATTWRTFLEAAIVTSADD